MPKRLICFSICVLIAQGLCGTRAEGAASTPAASNKLVESRHVQAMSAQDVFRDIAQREGVAIGVDAVLPEKEKATVLDFPGGTIADLLNMVVAQFPGYRWREEGGIIHVSRKDAHVSLADVVVSYPGAQHRTRLEMWMDIHERPEVKAWMKSMNCHPGEEPFHAKNFKPHKGPISIAPGSMTVTHLLDEVALQSGENYWAVLQRSSPMSHSCHVSVIVW
jgi:hypothetical protein